MKNDQSSVRRWKFPNPNGTVITLKFYSLPIVKSNIRSESSSHYIIGVMDELQALGNLTFRSFAFDARSRLACHTAGKYIIEPDVRPREANHYISGSFSREKSRDATYTQGLYFSLSLFAAVAAALCLLRSFVVWKEKRRSTREVRERERGFGMNHVAASCE